MNNLRDFSLEAAKRYLQNVVFIDDQIYNQTGMPVEITTHLPELKSPFGAMHASESSEPKTTKNNDAENISTPYHPKNLVESFAREGMVCALYEPSLGFDTSPTSEIFKLCERADIVILDWDLFGQPGTLILPLLKNLVGSSQSSIPHHVRLCAIYTTTPNLEQVANTIFEYLGKHELAVDIVGASLILNAGATRICVLGKPNVSGRTATSKGLEIKEQDLAQRVISEFAKMNGGLLASYSLYGLASMRRNSKKLLDKFHSDMDGPFLLHRALTINSEDAFDQLPELLAEEILSVIDDEKIPSAALTGIVNDVAQTLQLDVANLDWNVLPGRQKPQPGVLARVYLAGGADAIKEDHIFPDKGRKVPIVNLHNAMGCEISNGHKKLANLFNVRTQYSNKNPSLKLGTLLRWEIEGNYKYAVCLMPLCDSIRLSCTGTTTFPFWELNAAITNGANGRGVILKNRENIFVDLMASGKPKDKLFTDKFTAHACGVAESSAENNIFYFQGENRRYEWVAQLKPSHAQRIAHDIGQTFSRVGLVEAEWVRLITDAK